MISLAHKNRTFLNSTSLKQDQSSHFLHSARNKIIKIVHRPQVINSTNGVKEFSILLFTNEMQ